jgi:hypothetical protein
MTISSNARALRFETAGGDARAGAGQSSKLSRWLEAVLSWRPAPGYAIASSCAVLALATLATYQSIALRKQAVAPQAVVSFYLHPDARGEEPTIEATHAGSFFLLEADPPRGSQEWKWQIRSVPAQAVSMEGTTPAPTDGASLKLLIPASKLGAGQYVLSFRSSPIQPSSPPEVVYRFQIH